MAIPQLDYAPKSQNQRVKSFEVAGDEQPKIYTTEELRSPGEMDALIRAAYLQVFHEQQMLQHNRQTELESQLRNQQITVREFIRGLVLSAPFRNNNYDSNSNYRVVELLVQRLLGRDVYGDRETQSWAIVLATRGLIGCVDALQASAEYEANFGDDTVPYQRRRILSQRSIGDLPYQRAPRYTADYRLKLEGMGLLAKDGMGSGMTVPTVWRGLPPKLAYQIGGAIVIIGAVAVLSLVGTVALAALELISL